MALKLTWVIACIMLASALLMQQAVAQEPVAEPAVAAEPAEPAAAEPVGEPTVEEPAAPASNDTVISVPSVTTPIEDPSTQLAINLGYTIGFLGLNILLIVAFVVLMKFVKRKIGMQAIGAQKLRPESRLDKKTNA